MLPVFASRRIAAALLLLLHSGARGSTPGDPIPDIDITLKPVAAGRILHLISDANGAFVFSVPAGSYVLQIAAAPAPSATLTRQPAARTQQGMTTAPLLSLPDSVTARGGWPYQVRLERAGVAVSRVTLAAPAGGSAARTTGSSSPRAVEISLTVGSSAQPAASYSVRGRIESRQ